MLLSRLEFKLRDTCIRRARQGRIGTWVIHSSIDEIVVGGRELAVHSAFNKGIVVSMEPILENDGADVDVVILVFRPMYDHGAVSAAGVLGTVMA